MPIPMTDWNSVKADRGDYQRLQPGGYVARIVRLSDVSDQTGDYLLVEFDIAEGPFTGYYQRLFQQFPTSWNGKFRLYYNTPKYGETLGRLKAFMEDLNVSNGITIHQFDPRTLDALAKEGKIFGALMGYDKKAHKYLNVYKTCDAQKIRSGEYEIPGEWRIHDEGKLNSAYSGGSYSGLPSDRDVPDEDGDLPF